MPTARGHKSTGIGTRAAGWGGAIEVTLLHKDGEDLFIVEMVPWENEGDAHLIATGVLGDSSQLILSAGDEYE